MNTLEKYRKLFVATLYLAEVKKDMKRYNNKNFMPSVAEIEALNEVQEKFKAKFKEITPLEAQNVVEYALLKHESEGLTNRLDFIYMASIQLMSYVPKMPHEYYEEEEYLERQIY